MTFGTLVLLFFELQLPNSIALAIAIPLALIGIIASIIVLIKSGKDKKAKQKARNIAWFGLVIGLISIFNPIVISFYILPFLFGPQ